MPFDSPAPAAEVDKDAEEGDDEFFDINSNGKVSEEELHLHDNKEEIAQGPVEPDVPQDARDAPDPVPVPRRGRGLRDPKLLRPPQRYLVNVSLSDVTTTYENATDSKHWRQAIAVELDAHRRNKTWRIVKREENMRVIKYKWVFKLTNPEAAKPAHFKAKLYAKGFMQLEGEDYTDTFSPVVRYDSVRVLLATITNEDMEMVTFDVRAAFLYGELEEKVYMEVPDGLDISESEKEKFVLLLVKSLYGLKQAPRCWNKRFLKFLNKFNFKASAGDQCIFIGFVCGWLVYEALFVDDGFVACKSSEVLSYILKVLSQEFEITVGDASYFVGMQIKRNREKKEMIIHQSAYIQQVINKFGMSDAKSISVPADPNVILESSDESVSVSELPYRQLVGSLMYIAIVSRPDIGFAVNILSRFLSKYNHVHWRAAKRVVAYLIGTANLGIGYQCVSDTLVRYSDSDYARCTETRRSTTGYVFFLAGGPVTWTSHRQKLVTLSTTESEYVAAAAAVKEAVWLRILLNERDAALKMQLLFM